MELLAIVKAVIVISALGTVTTALGPHQEPAQAERVAVLGADGSVLYYNYK